MVDSNSASLKIFYLIYDLFQSDTSNFPPFWGSIFHPRWGGHDHMKNKGKYKFGTLKNIKIDTWIVRIEYFDF